MPITAIVPPLALLVLVLTFAIAERDRIRELASVARAKAAFSDPSSLTQIDELPLVPLKSPEVISGPVMQSALLELVEYAKILKPDYLFGIHFGGRLLSSYVCRELGLDISRCLYISTQDGPTRGLNIEGVTEFFPGTVLVIDDVSRTGDTLSSVKRYLEKSIYNKSVYIRKVKFAVLLVYDGSSGNKESSGFVPDWAAMASVDQNIATPWASLGRDIRNEFTNMIKGQKYDNRTIRFYNRVRLDVYFSMHVFEVFMRKENPSIAYIERTAPRLSTKARVFAH